MWYIISGFRTLIGILAMMLWIAGYVITIPIFGHNQNRALALRTHWLKYVAFPILNLKVDISGTLHDKTALYVSNHRSFNDPIVICRYLKAFVIAKAEVASYPVISQGAVLTGVIFVKRENKDSRSAVREKMIETIQSGQNVLVFPEGTVGINRGTLEFRKGAFIEAVAHGIPVVPIAVEYKSPKDLWVKSNFISQFLTMFAKPTTFVKVRIGQAIEEVDGVAVADKAQQWIDEQLQAMQQNWTEISFEG